MAKGIRAVCLSIFVFLTLFSEPPARSADSTACLMCHSAKSLSKTSDGKQVSLYVDPPAFASSMHGKKACVDCHADLSGRPLKHKPDVAPVDCARCHGDLRTLDDYQRSVHGAIGKGGPPAARCADCHSVHALRSAVETDACRKCHAMEFEAYTQGSHGRGNSDVPTCVKCHGAHDIRPVCDPESPVFPAKVPALCAGCHDDPKLMRACNLPTDRLKTYRASYHGIANLYGNTRSAVCTSCHDAHNVLPPDDPASSVSAARLPETCGRCHPNVGPKVAVGSIHLQPSPKKDAGVYWVSTAYTVFISLMMLAFCGYMGLDILAHWRLRRGGRG